MTPGEALAELEARADPDRAAQMAAYHKADRRYLGIPNGELDELVRDWRRSLAPDPGFAQALWASDIHEARVAAAKLLTKARIADDAEVWTTLASWVPFFDGWAIADHVAIAGGKRLVSDPSRLDTVETWAASDDIWTRRAALTFTLPWARLAHPKPEEVAARDRILGWAATMIPDRRWFIQKAIGWWLRDLSKKSPDATRAFLDIHGDGLKPFALREARRHLQSATRPFF